MLGPHRTVFSAFWRRDSEAARAEDSLWNKLLERRILVKGHATKAEQTAFRKQQAADRRRVAGKFKAVLDAHERSDETWRSQEAQKFEAWCKTGSWVICQECGKLEKRPLQEADISGSRRPCQIKKCKYCTVRTKKSEDGVRETYHTGYPTVQLSDIPEELRGLSGDVLWALRPLDLLHCTALITPHQAALEYMNLKTCF